MRYQLVGNLPGNDDAIVDIYRKRAKGYDTSGIQSLEKWRHEAVRRLNLGPGDLVVDVGCGTGLNFAALQEAIGPDGKIVGIDECRIGAKRSRAV
jgi:ubiquinone/menaquinone biosynthesis C-methylase UbiE